MSVPIPLRVDFDAVQLRGLARKTKDGPQARRLLALAAIYDGATPRRRRRSAASGFRSFGIGCCGSTHAVRTACLTANRQASPRGSMMPSAKPLG
jgi:hypothetical protein